MPVRFGAILPVPTHKIQQEFSMIFEKAGGTSATYADLGCDILLDLSKYNNLIAAYFEAWFDSAGTGGVQLYNKTDTAAIAGSEITTKGSRQRTGNILANLPTAAKSIIVQSKGDGTNAPTVRVARLILEQAVA